MTTDSTYTSPVSNNLLTDDTVVTNTYSFMDGHNNVSTPEGCMIIKTKGASFAWDNPHNLISPEVEIYARQVQTYAFLIFLLIGGPANVINMAVFWRQGLKVRVNLLLFSLSLADELTLIIFVFINATKILSPLFTKNEDVAYSIFIMNNRLLAMQGFAFVSIVLSAFIAVERCYCVLRPLKYQNVMSTTTTACVIVIMTVIMMALYFVSILRYNVACGFDHDTGELSEVPVYSDLYIRLKAFVDQTGNIFFGFIIPFGTLFVVGTATAVTVWKLRQAMEWRAETSSAISPKEVALTRVLVGTSVLFIVCVFPVLLFRSSPVFKDARRRYYNLFMLCVYINRVMGTINSTFNFFVYYTMGSKYRDTFWELFNRAEKGKKKKRTSTNDY